MKEGIRKSFIFHHLADDKIQLRLDAVKHATNVYAKGEIIKGTAGCIGILITGTIDVYRTLYTGQRLVVSQLAQGAVFGLVDLYITGAPIGTLLKARTEVTVLYMAHNDFFRWLTEDSVLLKAYMTYMHEKIHFLHERMACFTHMKIEDRLHEYQHHEALQQTKLNKKELAAYLGISRASLYRVLEDNQANEEML